MKQLLSILSFIMILSCVPSAEKEGTGFDSSLTVRLIDECGNIVKESAQVSVYLLRRDFNSYVPYMDIKVSDGQARIPVYSPAKMAVTVISKNYNPLRIVIERAAAGNIMDAVLKPRTGLRIMECNVDYGWGFMDPNIKDWQCASDKRKKAFTEWVKAYDPDVITFCELNCFGFGTSDRPNDIDADFQAFAKEYGHGYASLRKKGGRHSFSTGISSRYPLENIEKVELQTAQQTGYRVHGFIQAECKGVTVIACHLSSQDAKTRVIEADEIARRVSSKNYAMCSGDMNSDSREDLDHLAKGVWPGSRWWNSPPEYAPIDKFFDVGLKDSFYLASDAFQPTCSTMDRSGKVYDYSKLDKTGMKVDCIMLTEALAEKCDYAEVIQTKVTARASDHFPYMIHVEI